MLDEELDDMQTFRRVAGMGLDIMNAMIVLSQTNGVQVEARSTLHKPGKRRDAPEYSYHVLRIPGVGEGGSGITIGERKRVRLHLRRGHKRTQHHGRGNKQVKNIWIEPTLVGYQEEGEVYKDYEVA